MKIYVTIEPGYRNTRWCEEKLWFMAEKAVKLRHTISIVNAPYENINAKLIIIMGASPEWVEKTIYLLEARNIKALVLSCQPDKDIAGVSYVLGDHIQAMSMSIDYLKNVCGRKKIALFGINRTDYSKIAYSNRVKMRYFEPEDVFGDGGIDAGYDKFKAVIQNYDALFLIDHVVGMYIIKKMKEDGIKIPQDIFVMSFSNSKIYEIANPSVTTVSISNEYVGDQAIAVYIYLIKQKTPSSVLVTIPCDLKIGESTAGIEYNTPCLRKKTKNEEVKTIESVYTGYPNSIKDIFKLEVILDKCLLIDYKIIQYLDTGMTYAAIAQKLFVSETTVKYRVSRLIKISGTNGRKGLMELLKSYIDISKMDKYISEG